jgi:hypothetical protein
MASPLMVNTTTRNATMTQAHVLRHAQFIGHQLKTTEACEEGGELILHIDQTNILQEWAIKAHQGKTMPMASNVSEDPEYQRYWKASLEGEAQRFPRSRENDRAINLKPEAPTTLDCKVYPLNPLCRTDCYC